ncbi:MAG TPA: UvrB/UvrC motif-containing protein [Candidatus Sulfotelmatobacter sp.]|nr:UvrB/UvrC motif-containing protein [Candidatus Sulfotelmatobacter sp.]
MLRERLEFAPEHDREILAGIPAVPAVFVLRVHDPQAEPYVSKTTNLRRRVQRLLGPVQERTKRLNLRDRVGSIEYSVTGSDFESGFLLYKVLRATFPKTYAKRLRFRFAPFVKLHLDNPYPRASITTRIGKLKPTSPYYGPFPSRVMAEKFMNDSLDFFKMRRCVDDLHPDPMFPGCIYSEMKMCLAPCFQGCTDSEYAGEVARVQSYFDSRGESLLREVSSQRDAASANLEFEEAAAIHTRLEKIKPVLGQLPDIIHRLDRLKALMVQRSDTVEAVTFFRIDAGVIAGPAMFSIQSTEHTKSQSMESRIEEVLATLAPAKPRSSAELMENIALLRRWYFRSSRAGEIFFADDRGELPLRRIVRAISRVYRGETPETASG